MLLMGVPFFFFSTGGPAATPVALFAREGRMAQQGQRIFHLFFGFFFFFFFLFWSYPVV
jgi:hypothetical protein